MKRIPVAFIQCLTILFLVKLGFETLFNQSFKINVSVLFGRPNIFTGSISIVFVIFSLSFAVIVNWFYKKYTGTSFVKRLLLFAPLMCLFTLVLTAMISGFSHTINEMFKGVYSSIGDFLVNFISHPVEALIFGIYLIVFQFKYFTLTVFVFLFGVLELLRERYKTTPSS